MNIDNRIIPSYEFKQNIDSLVATYYQIEKIQGEFNDNSFKLGIIKIKTHLEKAKNKIEKIVTRLRIELKETEEREEREEEERRKSK
jgi:hypothetical protein